ncbi:MAG: hypothetical protein BWY68_00002 [bacterium ADurb.Bin400]|nr:MAG: hypothetical protein BWY68_00002 [bacterium ADurb.Bin400]
MNNSNGTINNSVLGKSIFELLSIDNIPQLQKSRISELMVKIILGRISARVNDLTEGTSILEDLTEEKNAKKVKKALFDKGIDLDQIAAEEVLAFKEEILSLTKQQR